VGQCEDDDVVPGEDLGRGRLEDAVGQGHQVRVVLAERGTRAGGSGQGADPELGVAQCEAEDFTTGVATGARNRDRPHDA